ncbi:MAG TPA: type II toxin-antitoxin system RelE/ParE family toxin [Povalibacter sp.]|nr:type II toxin-antitoxin system RelE/ParE family toxin [Povalibacter sp.]
MLPIAALEIREYLAPNGVSPIARWRKTLDPQVRARIDRVIERFADGNFGDRQGLGGGVLETRIDTGPGYRIYYGVDGPTLVILLAGGIKRSQEADIRRAKQRWSDYKERKRGD